jgi:hypothetical protein
MASNNQIIKNRYLAERSFMYYIYPQPAGQPSLEFYFPFLENIEISENQKPNLATYDLLGRNGNLYAYLGSRSREFSLKFNITLLNVLDYITNVGLGSQFLNKIVEDKDYYNLSKNSLPLSEFTSNTANNKNRNKNANFERRVQESIAAINDPSTGSKLLQSFINFSEGSVIANNENSERLNNFLAIEASRLNASDKSTKDAVNYTIVLLNIIRTSTINNSKNTSLGPPAIYLNHGTMYNNIPCICTGYSIDIKNGAGYDLLSLTPRQISISLTLSENRTGNFGEFKPFQYLEGENMAGWEAVIEQGTLDPYNSSIRNYLTS